MHNVQHIDNGDLVQGERDENRRQPAISKRDILPQRLGDFGQRDSKGCCFESTFNFHLGLELPDRDGGCRM
jgi:hypothetical protein